MKINPLGFLKALNLSDNGFILFKVLNRNLLVLLIAGVCFYFFSALLYFRFDTDGARNALAIVNQELGKYAPDGTMDAANLTKLDAELKTLFKAHNLQPVAVGLFVKGETSVGSVVNIRAPTTNISDINTLKGLNFLKRSDLFDISTAKLKTDFTSLNMDQFIVQGAFLGEFQLTIIKIVSVLFFLFLVINGVHYYHFMVRQKELRKEQEELRKEVHKGTDASPVWELAQVTLNKYYDRNLNQNSWIFYVSVVVMFAGFCLVLYGISMAFNTKNGQLATIISTCSGVVVQFIGATFLVIYNSTIKQAVEYTASLQKVSTIGTSIKILDSIKKDQPADMRQDKDFLKLMTAAKIDIAKSLIEQSKVK